MNDQPESKTLLITGATGGMGSACALLAAERGYGLVLSDLNGDRLDSLANECRKAGADVRFKALDITDRSAIEAFAADLQESGGISALVHTVGLSPQMAAWDKIVQVDLISSVQMLEAVRRAIEPGGSAVAISSMSAHMVPPHPAVDDELAAPFAEGLIARLSALPGEPLSNSGLAYAYAKKALIKYVANHAMDWGQEDKRLISISPGLIDTQMGRLEASSDEAGYAARRSLIALRREAAAREIATVALFLISNDASYITGCDLLVDGGFTASLSKRRQPT
jgi:NAD(P)-dependent dehydrogenase (short-subunit alcohol dehydrogenase family)